MPCYDPTPTERDKRAMRAQLAIFFLEKKLGLIELERPPWFRFYSYSNSWEPDSYYGIGLEKRLDEFTNYLCKRFRSMDKETMEKICYDAHDRESRFLADWWEDHLKIDKEAGRPNG